MLTPEYLETCPDELLKSYEQLEDDILSDMVRRIMAMGEVSESSIYQMQIYEEAGGVYNDAVKEISKHTGRNEEELKKLFEDGGAHALSYDDSLYQSQGLSPAPLTESVALLQVLKAGLDKTKGHIHNLTLTTANSSQQDFISALDRAYYQVSSGAMSYDTAIKQAVGWLSGKGVEVVYYDTGHRDKLDVATRRAALTGLNQTAAQLQMKRADEMGSDLVEVSAHDGARPSHQVWQGRIFSRSGKSGKYPPFESSTGYGTGAGLCGWNCRHSFYPYFDGFSNPAYSAEYLDRQDERNYKYNGEYFTNYEITQKQRSFERKIRKDKRQLVAFNQGRESAQSEEMKATMSASFNQKSVLLEKHRKELEDLLKQTGFDNQPAREQVYGFGRSVAMKAVWAAKKA